LELGQIRAKGAHLLHVRDGKVTKLVICFDRSRAFAHLGLAPELVRHARSPVMLQTIWRVGKR
jgi:hypothetical protein